MKARDRILCPLGCTAGTVESRVETGAFSSMSQTKRLPRIFRLAKKLAPPSLAPSPISCFCLCCC